jgi:hydroxymethylpyrimidine pyrophosphatase-like HAD family hydrolase
MNSSMRLLVLLQEDEDNDGWIGVDLDGTLAFYDKWKGEEHIGEPIPEMVKKVKALLDQGKDVKIMTARVSSENGDVKKIKDLIQQWCKEHLGKILPVTHEKDHKMLELWDDRVRQVVKNTGKFIDEE